MSKVILALMLMTEKAEHILWNAHTFHSISITLSSSVTRKIHLNLGQTSYLSTLRARFQRRLERDSTSFKFFETPVAYKELLEKRGSVEET